MVSIENLYFVLCQQLLKPLGMHDAIYYRFGSTQYKDLSVVGLYNKVQHFYGPPSMRLPWCYFFDQEPINAKSVEENPISYVRKTIRILGNSEHSPLKKQILSEHKYLDWYYFFHGFAALDWYRDAKYIQHTDHWDTPYLCMNRLYANDRSYRLNLVARLIHHNIVDRGSVSLNLQRTDFGTWQDEVKNPHSKLSTSAKDLIRSAFTGYDRVLQLDDIQHLDGSLSARFGQHEVDLLQNSLWNVVTETVFYHDKLHLTEKIFKPIVTKRPFMLAAAPGNLAYLKSYGFQTFDRWIDESYDTIQDNDQRLQAIVDQLIKLCAMPRHELQQMHKEMQAVLDYNFEYFWSGFRHKIVNEMIDNFETAIRIWNNGRFDDYIVPMKKIDFAQVKNLLLK